LFVSICPIINCIVIEFEIGKSLKRCSGKVKGISPCYLIKSLVSLVGIHTLVGLVDYEYIPISFDYFLKFCLVTTKVNRPLKVLKAYKFYIPLGLIKVYLVHILIPS